MHIALTQPFAVAGHVHLFTSHIRPMNGFQFIANVFIVLESKTDTIAIAVAVFNICFQ